MFDVVLKNERLRRSALYSCIFSGLCLIFDSEEIASPICSLTLVLTILDLFLAQTVYVIAHWRTIIPFSVNVVAWAMLHIDVAFRPENPVVSTVRSVIIGIILFTTSVLSLLLLYVLPVQSIPPLKGPYARVGTSTFNVPVKLSHSHQMYKGREEYDLTVQMWYPLSSSAPKRNLCLGHRYATLWTSGHPDYQTAEAFALLEAVAKSSSVHTLFLKHLSLTTSLSEFFPTPAHLAKAENGHHPVLIYSHGMYSWRQISSTTFEQLASYGFVVFACDHSPSAMICRGYGKDNEESFEEYDYDLPTSVDPSSKAEREHYIQGLDRRVHEIQTLMEYLESKNFPLDVGGSSFHLMGHSFGGGTMAAVAMRDNRVSSCVLLDSWLYPLRDEDLSKGFGSIPVLFISSELWSMVKFQTACRNFIKASSPRTLSVAFKGSTHTMFCDMHLIASPWFLRMFNMIGDVNLDHFVEALNGVVINFFVAAEKQNVHSFCESSESEHSSIVLQHYLGMLPTWKAKKRIEDDAMTTPLVDQDSTLMNSDVIRFVQQALVNESTLSHGKVSIFEFESLLFDLHNNRTEKSFE